MKSDASLQACSRERLLRGLGLGYLMPSIRLQGLRRITSSFAEHFDIVLRHSLAHKIVGMFMGSRARLPSSGWSRWRPTPSSATRHFMTWRSRDVATRFFYKPQFVILSKNAYSLVPPYRPSIITGAKYIGLSSSMPLFDVSF